MFASAAKTDKGPPSRPVGLEPSKSRSFLRHHSSTPDVDAGALAPGQLLDLQHALGNRRVAELLRRPTSTAPMAERAIDGSAKPGETLDPRVRAEMETQFDHDFSRVRVHHDDVAATAADAVDARAFTAGTDIVFDRGEYMPHSPAGRDLIAHELAHVVEQHTDGGAAGPVVQRQPRHPRPKPGGGDDTVRHGDYVVFSVRKAGITVKVGVTSTDEPAVRARIDEIVAEVVAANSAITEPAMKVHLCVIAPTTSRFALYRGKPVLLLDPSEPASTAAHEMGHAIFHGLTHQGSKPGGGTRSEFSGTAVRVADIYLRLKQTTLETREVTTSLDKREQVTQAVGMWMVDPTSWAGSSKPEHPWQDPDEFFASAREAFRTNPQGLRQAIRRASKVDPKVDAPAGDLLTLLAGISRGKPPSGKLPATRRDPATAELREGIEPGKLEDTIDSMSNQLMRWALDPSLVKSSTGR